MFYFKVELNNSVGDYKGQVKIIVYSKDFCVKAINFPVSLS